MCKLRRNIARAELSFHCHGNACSKIMARNFGIHPSIRRNNRATVWPKLVIACMAVGLITAAVFLHHR
jgi:hypothetical protein